MREVNPIQIISELFISLRFWNLKVNDIEMVLKNTQLYPLYTARLLFVTISLTLTLNISHSFKAEIANAISSLNCMKYSIICEKTIYQIELFD